MESPLWDCSGGGGFLTRHELAQKHTEVYDNDEMYVHAMELEKTGNELWIKIEWKEGLPIEQFCLKSNIQTGRITD
jgi:hypothetical protein